MKSFTRDARQRLSHSSEVREAGTPHPRTKIKTYLGIMGYLWALEWRKKEFLGSSRFRET